MLDCTNSVTPEKVLLAEDETTNATTTITLRGSWTETAVAVYQVVHVAHAPMKAEQQVISLPGQIFIEDTNTSPLLIILPDHMLSATAVADSFDCTRKAVLFDRIKATSEASKWTVYGKILHEIFQQALIANVWDEQSLHKLVISTVTAHLEGLWQIGMRDDVMAIEEIQAKMTELSAWASVFVRSTPSLDAKLNGSRDDSLRMAITGLVAIEEHVWSPTFGLKGNVDATVQIRETGKTSRAVIAPFEVKTGRTTHAASHHAQTALYTLLMSDRYDVAVKAGILYYLETSNISNISPSMHEIRQMIQQRNRLATAIDHAKHPEISEAEVVFTSTPPMQQSRLPGMARNAQKCGRCYAQQSCFVFHALCEDGDADTAGMQDDSKKNHSAVWDEALGHLLGPTGKRKDSSIIPKESTLKQWFTKWDRLLTFEEGETNRPRKELWTMSSSEREEAGRCFGKLKIRLDHLASSSSASTIDGIESSGGKINRFIYTLERSSGTHGRPFNDGTQLLPGEAIVVSSESGQWALANGYVVSSTNDSITVGVDRKLGDARQRLETFDEANNQVFKGIMNVSKAQQIVARELTTLYRLDKDEFANGLAIIRNNLVMMMSSHPNHTKLRDLIIFNEKPHFSKTRITPSLQHSQLGNMNEDQQSAVSKVISADDYALVLGMPGTGKTTTIAHLIRTLLAEGKSILLTSYTHTAVDNILLKIRDIAPAGSILRLGAPSKINAQVKQFCHLATSPRKSFEELDEVYLRTQIVATTCLGISNALFARRCFDVCIVDEASQITLPISLGPLLNARKFVLVGDHYQLSPLVQSRRALEGGLDISLFRLLSEKHPDAIAMLGKQYRMCEEIMSISNALIYDGRLRCGNDTVAQRTIHFDHPAGLEQLHSSAMSCQQLSSCWLQHITDPQRKVVFADTDAIGADARESLINSGKKITNRLEAVTTAQIVLALKTQGVPSSDIGVIALYRTQISLIKQLFGAASIPSDVEFDSADRFQGRDKECIIISMVRSNETGTIGDLIRDWRRLNVAFTRARSKLIVIGSRATLQNNELMARFLQHVDSRGQSLTLPPDVESNHGSAFDSVSQATSSVEPGLLPQRSPARKPRATPVRPNTGSQSRALQESRSGGNRGVLSPRKFGGVLKKPDKIIDGRSGRPLATQRKIKEQLAFELLEEINAEDWS